MPKKAKHQQFTVKQIRVQLTDTTTSTLLHQYAYAYDPAGNRTTGKRGKGDRHN